MWTHFLVSWCWWQHWSQCRCGHHQSQFHRCGLTGLSMTVVSSSSSHHLNSTIGTVLQIIRNEFVPLPPLRHFTHRFDSFPCRNFAEPTFWSNFRQLLWLWFVCQKRPSIQRSTRKCSQRHQSASWMCKHLSLRYPSIDLNSDKLASHTRPRSHKVLLESASHPNYSSLASPSKAPSHLGVDQSIFRWLDTTFLRRLCRFLGKSKMNSIKYVSL